MDRPATIILLAYNQASYIDEAVDSLFHQDYNNLQVILSDDKSSDQTFDIIKAKAKEYDGPHQILVNQTTGGKGIFNHLLDALAKATGDLIVIAAGDDISYPRRVSELMEAWSGSSAAAIFSSWRRIDASGKYLGKGRIESTRDVHVDAYFRRRNLPIAAGTTAAYSAEFLRSVPRPEIEIWAEDRFLSLIALAQDRQILSLDNDLVGYRQNPNALSNMGGMIDTDLLKRRNRFYYGQMVHLLDEFVRIHASFGFPISIDRRAVAKDQAWYKARSLWFDLSFTNRLKAMITQFSIDRFQWGIPRLLGESTLYRIKRYIKWA